MAEIIKIEINKEVVPLEKIADARLSQNEISRFLNIPIGRVHKAVSVGVLHCDEKKRVPIGSLLRADWDLLKSNKYIRVEDETA